MRSRSIRPLPAERRAGWQPGDNVRAMLLRPMQPPADGRQPQGRSILGFERCRASASLNGLSIQTTKMRRAHQMNTFSPRHGRTHLMPDQQTRKVRGGHFFVELAHQREGAHAEKMMKQTAGIRGPCHAIMKRSLVYGGGCWSWCVPGWCIYAEHYRARRSCRW